MEGLLQLSPFHALGKGFRLHYGPNFELVLNPCEPIKDGSVAFGIVDNNRINQRRLQLVPKDRTPIRVTIPDEDRECSVTLPGKSAIVCLDAMECGEDLLRRFITYQLSAELDRRDHIHVATVQQVREAGWTPIWAPLQLKEKLLHARLVAQRTIEDGSDPLDKDLQRLASAFMKLS